MHFFKNCKNCKDCKNCKLFSFRPPRAKANGGIKVSMRKEKNGVIFVINGVDSFGNKIRFMDCEKSLNIAKIMVKGYKEAFKDWEFYIEEREINE